MARRKRGHGKSAKAARRGQTPEALEEEYKKCPHSFVLTRGNVGKTVTNLASDMRKVMEPFTASNLRVHKRNDMKDFINIAGVLNVSHIVTFSKSEIATYMRVIRLPRGPTLTFRVLSYSLGRDIVSSLKRNEATKNQFETHPLIVLNHLRWDQGVVPPMHLKLMSTMLQNMFPSIYIDKLKLSRVKRCVLFNYNQDDGTIDFRHYHIRIKPVGLSRPVKKLVRGEIPNMAKYNDISDYVLRGNVSESEADQDLAEVTLPQDMPGKGNVKSSKSAICLTEIGPRMKLQLVKIEEGVCTGEVLYHKYIEKTDEEKAALKLAREQKQKLKDSRRKTQQANVEKKKAFKEEHKKKSLEGMKKTQNASNIEENKRDGNDDDDDDAEYFRQEVGAEPETGMFEKRRKRPSEAEHSKKSRSHTAHPAKRRKKVD